MKLYLVQHGKAASKEVDPARPLTGEGRQGVENVAEFIRPLKLSVAHLLHSDKKRAIETAEILANDIAVAEGRTQRQGLAPNDDVVPIADEIEGGDSDVMIVGHMPFLSKLVSLLLTGDQANGCVVFRNGGIVCLNQTEQNRWQVEWIITPELLG